MSRCCIDLLRDEGCDISPAEDVQECVDKIRSEANQLWECIKYARHNSNVGKVAGLLDAIDSCVDHIEKTLLSYEWGDKKK